MTFRQMLPFLFLNVIVSAAVVLGILFWWDSRQPDVAAAALEAATTVALPLPTSAELAPVAAVDAAEAAAEAPADGPPVHTVAAGETLGIISNQYDVSLDDIMEANGLDNPDLISVGQQLIIPVGGIPVATATVEVTVALPSPIPTEPVASEGTAEIEVATVESVGELEAEAVQIVNSGTSEQSLLGWKVRDEDGNVYTFGQASIFGEGAGIRLHTGAGTNGPADLYWGLTEPVWRAGEVLTLWNAENQVIVRFVVP